MWITENQNKKLEKKRKKINDANQNTGPSNIPLKSQTKYPCVTTNIVSFYYLALKTNYVLYVKLKSMVIFHSKGFTGVCFNSLLYCKDKKL